MSDRKDSLASVRGFVHAQPVSILISIVLVVLAVVSGGVQHGPADGFRDMVGVGLGERTDPNRWLATLGSVLFSGSLLELVVTLVAVLVLVGATERRIGWRKTVTAYVVTGVVATVVGLGVQVVGLAIHLPWAVEVAYDTTLHPFTPALGTIMTASAFAGPLWRRRIRLVGFAGITTFLLYDGHPSSMYALIGAAAGLVLGVVLRPRHGRPERTWTRSSHNEARVLLSALVTITAIGPVVTVLTRAPIGPLAPLGSLFENILPRAGLSSYCRRLVATAGAADPRYRALCIRDEAIGHLHGPGTIVLSLLPLATLLVASFSIRRGRRLAVWVAAVVNIALAALAGFYYAYLPLTSDETNHLPGRPAERALVIALSVAVPLAVAVILVLSLHHFTVRTPRVVAVGYAVTVASAFVGLAAIYIVTGYLGRMRFSPDIDLQGLLVSAPQRFVPLGFLGLHRLGPVPVAGPLRVVYQTVGPVFWLFVVVGLVGASAATARRGASVQRRGAVDAILRRGVPGGLSHMATWEGNSYWFSADRQSAVAYRIIGGVALTTGEPLCDESQAAEVVSEFARWCDDRGVTPVFYSVRGSLTPIFARMRWSTLPVGEETVLHPASFSMTGKKWQDVRSSFNRAAKNGVRAEWTAYSALRPALARQISDISEQWVAEKDLPEMGFTLGGLDELMDTEVRLMLALDASDRVLAVTSWLPNYRDGEVIGWTLDFMRRRPDSMNGVMEFLIASAVLHCQADHIDFLSLSAAPLASSGTPDVPASQTDRLLAFLGRVLEPAYGFQSLLTFKEKFQPEFVPLVMAYPDPLALPAIGSALTRAYLPDLSVRQIPKLIRTMV